MTQLLDLHWYTLPDGTPVLAREVVPGRFRLDSAEENGPPLYLQDTGTAWGVWRRLMYDATNEGYAVVPCDLTSDDLWPVDTEAKYR